MSSPAITSESLPVRPPHAVTTQLDDMDALVATYEQRIFRFHLMSVRDRDLALTLTQDTFTRAWAARANFRGDCAISTWLMRIALNLIRDHTRTDRFRFWKRASETAVDVSEIADHLPRHESSPEAALIAREQLRRVWDSVGRLSDRQRNVFMLRFVEELELGEIAELTAMPVSTVKTHLYRALASLRETHTAQQRPRGKASGDVLSSARSRDFSKEHV